MQIGRASSGSWHTTVRMHNIREAHKINLFIVEALDLNLALVDHAAQDEDHQTCMDIQVNQQRARQDRDVHTMLRNWVHPFRVLFCCIHSIASSHHLRAG